MKEFKKYSYKDWWEGKVILYYACDYVGDIDDFCISKCTLPSLNKNNLDSREKLPEIVDYAEFTEEDVLLIKQKQSELFEEAVNSLFQTYTANFIKKYNASRMPKEYLEHEINQCEQIILEELPYSKIIQLSYWDMSFPRLYLTHIHGYINDIIINGNVFDCCSIQSPNSKYQDTTFRTAPIYAEFIFRYSEWLKANFITSKKGHEIAADEKTSEQVKSDEVINPAPQIFTSEVAYRMFIELKSLTVKEDTAVADYAFIFHKMKGKKLIFDNVTHPSFIDYLRNTWRVDISATKFPFKNQKAKQVAFDSLLSKLQK